MSLTTIRGSLAVLVCFVLTVGTGCTNEAEPNGVGAPVQCEPARGAYIVEYLEQSGTCGPLPGLVVVVDEGTNDGSCSGFQEISPDGCEITSDIVCRDDENLLDMAMAGVVRFGAEGAVGTGTFQLRFDHDFQGTLCQSVYDVQYTSL